MIGQASSRGAAQALPPTEESFDKPAVDRIIRRAMEIEAGVLQMPSAGMSPQALEQAATELGLDVSHMRAAITEERLGLLDPRRQRLDAVVGPSRLVVSRTVDMDSHTVLDTVDRWLTGSLMFHRLGPARDVRSGPAHRPGATNSSSSSANRGAGTPSGAGPVAMTYLRRRDMLASIRRSTANLVGAPDLSRIVEMEVRVSPEGPESSILVLDADVGVERALTVATGTAIAGLGSAVSVVGSVAMDHVAVPMVGIPLSLGLSVLVMTTRARTTAAVRIELTRVLELVAAGSPPGVRQSIGEAANRLMTKRRSR